MHAVDNTLTRLVSMRELVSMSQMCNLSRSHCVSSFSLSPGWMYLEHCGKEHLLLLWVIWIVKCGDRVHSHFCPHGISIVLMGTSFSKFSSASFPGFLPNGEPRLPVDFSCLTPDAEVTFFHRFPHQNLQFDKVYYLWEILLHTDYCSLASHIKLQLIHSVCILKIILYIIHIRWSHEIRKGL